MEYGAVLAEVSRRKIEAENKAMEEEERKKSILEGRAGRTVCRFSFPSPKMNALYKNQKSKTCKY
jgi:hypothetical protein